MLFETNLTVAIRCMECGEFCLSDISLFELHKSGMYEIHCRCGKFILKLKSSHGKTVHMYLPCEICSSEHIYTFSGRNILVDRVSILECPATGVELAFIGNRQKVFDMVCKFEKDLQELIDVLL